MDFGERLLLLLMIEVAGLFCQHSIWKCTKEVSNCPITEELWYKRWKDFPCFGDGLNYTCMKAAGGVLVEACINEYEIRAFTGSRCPFIHSCDGIEPVLAIEGNWPICPEGVHGCPPADHPVYTVYHMYKYPACIVKNMSQLLTTTLPEDIASATAVTSNVTTSDESNSLAYGSDIIGIIIGVIVGAILIIIFIIIVCVWKICRMRKVRRNMGDYRIELCNNQPGGSDESTQLLNNSGFYNDLKKRLVEFSKRVTEMIPMSPVQTFGSLPVELLYTKVVLQTNARFVQMGRQFFEDANLEREQKKIENPTDLFYKYGEPTKRIFMIGDAAHGKTTYCLWLLQHWYQAHGKGTTTQDEWGKEIGNFDFVFLVRLRDVQKSRGNVIDMICKDILGIVDEENINWIKEALKSGNYRSLILIDGLDEWKPDLIVTSDLKFKGIPITDDIENCVIFITMRTWKLEEVSMEINPEDRVVEILGLDENGLHKVTENVLLNHFGLNPEKPEDKLKYDTILNKSKNKTLASIMKIPLIAVLCVQILYKGDEIGNSLTKFYTAMVNMLIERTKERYKADRNHDHSNACYIHKHLLLKLGKLGYEGLVAGRYIFELSTETILEEIGLTRLEWELSLNIGLLSSEEADGTMEKRLKFYFFHTSVQEYLGALYIMENEGIFTSFVELLSSVKDILQFGNILVFLTGLDVKLGSIISKHIADVANNENDVFQCREINTVLYRNKKQELLYELQVNCYKELRYTNSVTDVSNQVLLYHVSDVYVCHDSDKDTIGLGATADILTHHHSEIKSIVMLKVPNDVENGIPDSLLTQYLDQSVSLQSLYINGYNTKRTFHHISDVFSSLTVLILYNIRFTPEAFSTLQTTLQSNKVIQIIGLKNISILINQNESKPASLSGIIQILPDLPRLTTLYIQITNKDDKPVFRDWLSSLSHLHGIRYVGTSPSDDEYDRNVVHTLCTWSGLRQLYLSYVNLGDRGLQLRHDMLHLETVVLARVDMLPFAWNRFIESILNINQHFDIILWEVNTEVECLTLIRSYPQLRITSHEVANVGTCRHNVYFTRVCPPSE